VNTLTGGWVAGLGNALAAWAGLGDPRADAVGAYILHGALVAVVAGGPILAVHNAAGPCSNIIKPTDRRCQQRSTIQSLTACMYSTDTAQVA
jgi:hypothetical protein